MITGIIVQNTTVPWRSFDLRCVALRSFLAAMEMPALYCGTLRCGIFYAVFNELCKSLRCVALPIAGNRA